MKFIGLLVCLCFLVLAVSAGPPQEGTGTAGTITQAIPLAQVSGNSTPPNGPSDPAEVEAFFDRVMPANLARYNVPGATVAVVKDGRVVLIKGYGYSDINNKTLVDANTTTFRIASVTKLFTWTAVMQLEEAGKIDLNADVNTYLKGFEIPDTYPGHPVTMRSLMTHTAGFEDENRHSEADNATDIIPLQQYCADNIPARVYPPGTVSSYSNYGAALAAVVVEDVSGMPFDQYLQSHILTPLSMNQTSIREDLPPDLASNLSAGYLYANGVNVPVHDAIVVAGPAGSISSTAPDMAKFMLAHLGNGTYGNATILSGQAASLMHARAFANDPRVAGMCLGFYEQQYNGVRTIGHGGDTDTFHSLLILLPDQQAGFFVAYNSPGGSPARDELFTEFMNHYYPAEPPAVPVPGPSDASRLQQYAGTYESNRHSYTKFDKFVTPNPQLEISATPNGTLTTSTGGSAELVEVRPGVFSPQNGILPASGNLVFHAAADGAVDYFCLGNMPFLVYDRVPWYATAGFLDDLMTAAGILLATVLLWPLLFVFRRAYAIPEPSVPIEARIARWIAGAAALVLLVFTVVLLPAVTADKGLVHAYLFDQAVPALLTAVLTVPVIAAVLTGLTVIFTVLAWKSRYWTFQHLLHYTIITIALVAMLWWVNFWNLWVFCL